MNRAPTGGNQLHKMKCMLVRYFLSCCPAQIWLTCRQCLVQSTYYRCVRSCLDDLWICADLFVDLTHNTYKVVERLACLGFSWFDHQGFMDHQWEVGCGCIHSKIEQALGDIQGCYAMFILLVLGCGDELVLTRDRIGNLIVRR